MKRPLTSEQWLGTNTEPTYYCRVQRLDIEFIEIQEFTSDVQDICICIHIRGYLRTKIAKVVDLERIFYQFTAINKSW